MQEFPECERVILHDVDLIPDRARARGYSLSLPSFKHILALNTTGEYSGMTNYIGGICGMSPDTFEEINGFPNEMEGWGGEDDALRDRLPPSAIHEFTDGAAYNLELDPGHAAMYTRARNCDAFKSSKEVRREIRTLWKAHDPSVTGCSQLLFSRKRLPSPSDNPDIRIYELDIFGWSAHTSRTTGKTYYVHGPSEKTQWTVPC